MEYTEYIYSNAEYTTITDGYAFRIELRTTYLSLISYQNNNNNTNNKRWLPKSSTEMLKNNTGDTIHEPLSLSSRVPSEIH